MSKDDFFTPSNLVTGVTEEDYRNAGLRLEGLRAMERLSNRKFYVIDYFRKTFLYVSEGFADFCGLPREYIKRLGFDLYVKHVPEDDLRMLLEINRQQFKLLGSFTPDDAEEYKICCDFCFECHGHRQIIYHQLTPFAMKDGRVWLALCSASMSSSTNSGNVVIVKGDSSICYDFNLCTKNWKDKRKIRLSRMERDVIMLSACGMTVQGISQYLCRSLDAVKSCKRKLFKKLCVKSISEAITYAMNHHLL